MRVRPSAQCRPGRAASTAAAADAASLVGEVADAFVDEGVSERAWRVAGRR